MKGKKGLGFLESHFAEKKKEYMKWEVYMRVFTGLVLIFTAPYCAGLTDPQDVMAINNLYVSLGYPPLQGWLLVGGDPCVDLWQGVECVFSNITAIKLSNANLGGVLGDSLQFFGSVIEIDLSNNHIGGSIPSALPVTLRILSLSANNLTGSIPPSLSTLTQLLDLSLHNNNLSGGIPDAFRQLNVLTNLDLSTNNLSGQLPPSLGNLSSLTTLHLQDNKLSGFLDVLQALPLQDLDITNNVFSGPIPAKLLTIPTFRKDGNPFNTTPILPPQAAPPQSVAWAPSPGGRLWRHMNGPSSSRTATSEEARKFFTSKTITWISVAGVSVVIALLLCLLLSRCCRAKKKDENSKKHYIDAHEDSSVRPKYGESALQQSNQMETAVPNEAIVKPLDRNGLNKRRMGTIPKLHDEHAIDMRRIDENSVYKRDHETDMTDMNEEILPPPPPPAPLPVHKAILNPVTTSRRPVNSINSSAAKAFTVAALQQHTNSFSQENFIGAGVLGSVYRAELPDGKVLAVKKLENTAFRQQSDEDFFELVSNISKLRHPNVVELVGYCSEHGQRLLVYEYCINGSLHDALHIDDEIHQKLSWNGRIRVALGAARALEYLHEVCQPPVVHRNFKSANLLLDEKLEIHVSDCGLAPVLSSASVSQMSGSLLNAYGYGAPEFDSGTYTYQSDVYSFGVVLLELLTGRKSYDRSQPRGEQYLVRWAVPKLHDIDSLSRMVDPSLHGAYPKKSLSRFADIISSCLQREPEFRPPISEIVQELLQMI
ncbi:protein STRUBBELIG-RECEPTOR FAMILY 3 isoform X1 [Ziziphus jujuba]|uniref:Protein STRUBBELIG-RECEPTOR FAMILY 3 isoform X1 n=1 Tax=Ziziphus jujuba TaxID=326968 RepID=A0ABM3ZZ83_ZIZJJ|nr:protein STRUBBELIG-RECEPTOR FAMILY 3 isoform X1 [Ziziphus jujuba]XP_060669798.1 protein STRUBBELIG-RECEPTOR FAMILY 3 isoform X1 [Ziziphus jujuba]